MTEPEKSKCPFLANELKSVAPVSEDIQEDTIHVQGRYLVSTSVEKFTVDHLREVIKINVLRVSY